MCVKNSTWVYIILPPPCKCIHNEPQTQADEVRTANQTHSGHLQSWVIFCCEIFKLLSSLHLLRDKLADTLGGLPGGIRQNKKYYP